MPETTCKGGLSYLRGIEQLCIWLRNDERKVIGKVLETQKEKKEQDNER